MEAFDRILPTRRERESNEAQLGRSPGSLFYFATLLSARGSCSWRSTKRYYMARKQFPLCLPHQAGPNGSAPTRCR